MRNLRFPGGKPFAFSILDDTDEATLENIAPIYDLFKQCGLRTTKTVWVYDCPSESCFAGDTLQRQPYFEFVRTLAKDGFEIAFHGATKESSDRERTVGALEFLRKEFGYRPMLFCNHGFNRENLYWGVERFRTRTLRLITRLGQRRSAGHYAGDDESSAFFWGDACKAQVKYVRNFTFRSLNLTTACRCMPYSLPSTPYVNYWFSTSEAQDAKAFIRMMTRERIDRLARDGGVCIISTHLGKGYVADGRIDGRFADLVEYLSGKKGWFVPVSDILDYLLWQKNGQAEMTPWELMRLETRFLYDRILRTLFH